MIRLRFVVDARGKTRAYRKIDRGRRWILVDEAFARSLVARGRAYVTKHFVGERQTWPRREAP